LIRFYASPQGVYFPGLAFVPQNAAEKKIVVKLATRGAGWDLVTLDLRVTQLL
jgi:hypothetical protein